MIREPTYFSSLLMEHQLQCNDSIITYIQNVVFVDIKRSTLYAEITYQLWNEFEQKLAQYNALRVYKVKQSIANLVQKNGSASVCFSKLKELLDELANYELVMNCTCGNLKSLIEHQEREQSMKFLIVLDESYENIKTQVLMMKLFPNLNGIYSIVQQEEKRRKISTNLNPNSAMAFNIKDSNKNTKAKVARIEELFCTHCKTTCHSLKKCQKVSGTKPTYTYCGISRYGIDTYYRVHGYLKDRKTSGKGKGVVVNQVTTKKGNKNSEVGVGNMITQEQYSQLISLLQQNTALANVVQT